MIDMTLGKDPQYVACKVCKHTWIAYYAPIAIDSLVAVMQSARCASCDADAQSIVMAQPPPEARFVPAGALAWKGLSGWFRYGETGMSSLSIVRYLTHLDMGKRTFDDTPRDPHDLRRCRLLLEAVPELERIFHRMHEHSPGWGCVIDSWDELCELMDGEHPEWRSAAGPCPNTLARMEEIGLLHGCPIHHRDAR